MEDLNEVEPFSREPHCIAPWTSLYLSNDGNVFPCCHWTRFSPLGNVSEKSLGQIWDSNPMKSLRLDMLTHGQHPSCQDCRFYENAGYKSLRNDYNETQKKHISRFKKTSSDGSAEPISLIYLSIAVGSTCQLQCRTCGPSDSSKWRQSLNFKIDNYHQSEHIDKLKEVLANSPKLERLLFVGGEPTIEQLHYDLIDYLLSLNRKTLPELYYNSNLVQIRCGKFELIDIWSKFPKINLRVSIDGDKTRFSFLRTGHSWPLMERNLAELNKTLNNISFTAYITVSVYNFLYLRELITDILDLGVFELDNILFNIVKTPSYMSCGIANPNLKRLAKERVNSFIQDLLLKYELREIARLVSGLRSILHYLDINPSDQNEYDLFLAFNKKYKPKENFGKFEDLFQELVPCAN